MLINIALISGSKKKKKKKKKKINSVEKTLFLTQFQPLRGDILCC
jgi:hypothetical protein